MTGRARSTAVAPGALPGCPRRGHQQRRADHVCRRSCPGLRGSGQADSSASSFAFGQTLWLTIVRVHFRSTSRHCLGGLNRVTEVARQWVRHWRLNGPGSEEQMSATLGDHLFVGRMAPKLPEGPFRPGDPFPHQRLLR